MPLLPRLPTFTDAAQQALTRAHAGALRRGRTEIQPHDLLDALLRGTGVAARAMHELGVRLDEQEPQADVPPVASSPEEESSVLAPDTRRAIEAAVDEMWGLRYWEIGAGHLLLGVLARGDRATTDLLARHGLPVRSTVEELRRRLREGSSPD
jgi:ATP-dependent Clp protease ATP-binding subunit ClpA